MATILSAEEMAEYNGTSGVGAADTIDSTAQPPVQQTKSGKGSRRGNWWSKTKSFGQRIFSGIREAKNNDGSKLTDFINRQLKKIKAPEVKGTVGITPTTLIAIAILGVGFLFGGIYAVKKR